ncbi:hypothetical protein MPTK1_4g14540 [Marchantia polymorpha subsp. ruderalis]|uniref:Uncharacterized protein n=2 Tax=Marchantia polymorpha TaxID=3197 RepID=A0AAF6B9W2_MARPO|nr:hypothetical protein MARPO_0070s0027 [Marchantia polymorpha]BBN08796.1 hypothetical protein Mp_4g14540 [Marchantia polymorpha subsp. ruderalis]|eukprot:PTQ35556.1 hypothetical protein MARPO_0070s0027 [Marchantia polymorpha]
MGVVISLPIGVSRTLVGVVQKYVLGQNKPLRIDLPLPFIPIDVVLVSDSTQIVSITGNPDVDRLHAQPTEKLPFWTRWYFSGTRFHNKSHDKWFLAFEPQSETVEYSERRKLIVDGLSTGFVDADVKAIADQISSNASEEAIAVTITQIVNGRFMGPGKDSIQLAHVQEARNLLQTSILDALVPGHQQAGVKAQEATYDFCSKNVRPGTNVMDAAHNVGNTANIVVSAIMTLKANVDTPIEHLFTRKGNCPTPQVPRVVMKDTTLNGLLSYPGRPSSTIILMQISEAAEQTNSLFFTFGTGSERRVCAFKDFFFDFMSSLQSELKSRQK